MNNTPFNPALGQCKKAGLDAAPRPVPPDGAGGSGNEGVVDFPPLPSAVPGIVAFDLAALDKNDHHFSPHRHRFHEIIHLTSGSAEHVVDGHAHTLKAPCAAFVNPWQIHHWRAPKKPKGRTILFTEDFAATAVAPSIPLSSLPLLGQDTGSDPIPFDLEADREFEVILAQLEQEMETGGKKAMEICGALVYVLLCLMQRGAAPVRKSPPQNDASHMVQGLRALVIESPSITLSVEDCASKLGVSRHQLDRAARLVTGMSAHQIMREMLVLTAKRLLANGRMSVTEAALTLGFNDNSYFSRMFKKSTGMSPSRFRLPA